MYNKARNYLTKKPFKSEKFKINFQNSTLLAGWDVNKEAENSGILFQKGNQYYLGIMAFQHRKLFQLDQLEQSLKDVNIKLSKKLKEFESKKSGTKVYETLQKGIENLNFEKKQLEDNLKLLEGNECFQKMEYKQISDVKKDIQNLIRIDGKFVRKTVNLDALKSQHIPEIYEIREKRSYLSGDNFDKQDLEIFISYYQEAAINYWDWCNFQLKKASEYETWDEFLDHVDSQGYKIIFQPISTAYIEQCVKEGKLFLFQIYNKDFSEQKKAGGKDNLHTLYWKGLFEPKNLKDTVLKLNGQAEIFFRRHSIKQEDRTIHYADKPIENKNPDNEKKESCFDYDMIKDKRFTEDL